MEMYDSEHLRLGGAASMVWGKGHAVSFPEQEEAEGT